MNQGNLPGSPFAHHPSFRGGSNRGRSRSGRGSGRGRGSAHHPAPNPTPFDIPLIPLAAPMPGANLNHLAPPHLHTQQPHPTHHMVFDRHRRQLRSVPINGPPKSCGTACCYDWCGDFDACDRDCCTDKLEGCCCLPLCICVCGSTRARHAIGELPHWVWFIVACVLVALCIAVPVVVVKQVFQARANASKKLFACKSGVCVGNPYGDVGDA